MELLSLVRCPTCHGKLAADGEAYRCGACPRRFEVIHGIPDFRPDPPDGEPRHGDFCLEIIRRWPQSSYRDLWALYHEAEADALTRLWTEHEERAPARGERRWDDIVRHAALISDSGFRISDCQPKRSVPSSSSIRNSQSAIRNLPLPAEPPLNVALDIGCGMGSALFALAGRARLAVGLDILLTDLLLAKKRFAEAGIANAAFVCGSALELPLAAESCDVLNATDVIEHVPDPPRLLAEGRRVMRPGGIFFFNSPNRFSLFTPEPHVKLWWVGWLPRRWMEPYVRWRRGKPYRGKCLLSLCELRRMARAAFGRDFAVRSFLPRRGATRALARAAEFIGRPVLPQHNVLAWKPGP